MSGISIITIMSGAFRSMMTGSCSRCWSWRDSRPGFPGSVWLNKREAFSQAFDGFDLETVMAYEDEKLEELQNDPGIIRNRLKIRAAVTNAAVFMRSSRNMGAFRNTSGAGPEAGWSVRREGPALPCQMPYRRTLRSGG